MNSSSEDLKDMLDTTSAGADIGVFGTDLFFGREPSKPDACVTILDSGGFPSAPESRADAIEYPTVQIRVRGAKGGLQNAYTKMESIVTALHSLTNETWNSTKYIFIFVIGSPMSTWDDNDRPIYLINFRIARSPA